MLVALRAMPIIASRSEDLKAPTPKERIGYDSVSAGLPHALAALTLKRSVSRDSGATHELSTSDNNENNGRGGTDSGYASAVPTPVSSGTPENSGTPETSHVFPQGIQNVPPIPYPGVGKGPALKVFDKPVSQTLKNRFEDLNELFGKSLMDRLIKSGLATGEIRSISIKLKFVGRDEETAVPCVIILCNKSTSKTVKHFFSSKQVKIQYQPARPSVDTPRFEIKVWERPPRLIGAAAYIFEPSVAINMEYPALCGLQFVVRAGDEMRYGTLGGFLRVQSFSGSSKLYMMSAGHLTAPSPTTTQEIKENPSGTAEDLEDDDEDSSVYSDLFGDELELDWDDAETEASSVQSPSQTYNAFVHSWIHNDPNTYPKYIGDVTISSHSGIRIDSAPNFDWSLIEVPDGLSYPRLDFTGATDVREEWKDISCFTEEDVKEAKTVLTLMGKTGRKTGVLSSTRSFLAVSPGQDFVKTYTLKLDDGAHPTDGDCGSWVVDSQTGKVYGHIVALDAFGEAYIVPLRDSFRDMEIQLDCESVGIPTGQQMCDFFKAQERPSVTPAQGLGYESALYAAAASGQEAVVMLLLDKGADVNAQGGEYGSALHVASASGQEAVVKLLLDKGADVNAQGGEYGSALHVAAASGQAAIVKLLLDKGADISAQGGKYRSALQPASASGQEESFSPPTVVSVAIAMSQQWVPPPNSQAPLSKPDIGVPVWQQQMSTVVKSNLTPLPQIPEVPQQASRDDSLPKLRRLVNRLLGRKSKPLAPPQPQHAWPQPIPMYAPYSFRSEIDDPYGTKLGSYGGGYTTPGVMGVGSPYYSPIPPLPQHPPPAPSAYYSSYTSKSPLQQQSPPPPTDSGYSSMQPSPAPSNPNSPAPARQEPLGAYQAHEQNVRGNHEIYSS